MAVDPPQQKFLSSCGPKAEAIAAFQTDRKCEATPPRTGMNQRYPVVAPRLWSCKGRINIRNQAFLDDPAPIQDDCPCIACQRFSRAYLAHLFRARELLGYRLATCHNLTFTLDFMVRIRRAIKAGSFPAALPELRLRAGRMSRSEGTEKSA